MFDLLEENFSHKKQTDNFNIVTKTFAPFIGELSCKPSNGYIIILTLELMIHLVTHFSSYSIVSGQQLKPQWRVK